MGRRQGIGWFRNAGGRVATALTNRYTVAGQDRQRDEMGRWLNGYRWDHFVTLTHRYPQSGDRDVYAWLRRLEQRAGRAVQFAVFSERTTDGFVHHHALIHGSAGLGTAAVRQAWKSGISHVEEYDASRGASHYVCKHYGDAELVSWNVSRGMPPTRRT